MEWWMVVENDALGCQELIVSRSFLKEVSSLRTGLVRIMQPNYSLLGVLLSVVLASQSELRGRGYSGSCVAVD